MVVGARAGAVRAAEVRVAARGTVMQEGVRVVVLRAEERVEAGREAAEWVGVVEVAVATAAVKTVDGWAEVSMAVATRAGGTVGERGAGLRAERMGGVRVEEEKVAAMEAERTAVEVKVGGGKEALREVDDMVAAKRVVVAWGVAATEVEL